MPRNMHNLADQLPSATYQVTKTEDDSLKFPKVESRKRHTVAAVVEGKVFKRYKSVERAGVYLSLNKTDHLKKNNSEKEEFNEEKSSLIKKIIKVKQDIDHEFNRMAAPQQIPRTIELPIQKNKRNDKEQYSQERVVMQEGVYD